MAARWAFHAVLNFLRPFQVALMGDPELMRSMRGVIQILTMFASSGEGSREDLIVAQAVRQNVKAAMTLPMNVMEWASMTFRLCMHNWEGGRQSRHCLILACLSRVTQKYDASVEVNTYDVEPVAKRARMGPPQERSSSCTFRSSIRG